MANLDEDYYQKTGTENDAPDPMVPDKVGWWWCDRPGFGVIPIHVLGDPIGGKFGFYENSKWIRVCDCHYWHGPCLRMGDKPPQDAPGWTQVHYPDTKRRDDHAAYVASVRKAVATDVIGFAAGYLTDEEWDSVDASVEDYLMSQDAAYRAVWDHATKHALEDAEADGVVMGMPAPRR